LTCSGQIFESIQGTAHLSIRPKTTAVGSADQACLDLNPMGLMERGTK